MGQGTAAKSNKIIHSFMHSQNQAKKNPTVSNGMRNICLTQNQVPQGVLVRVRPGAPNFRLTHLNYRIFLVFLRAS